MSFNNSEKFIVLFSKHIANINKVLKDIKLDIVADFIWSDSKGLMITTKKVMFTLDLNNIEKYIKNIEVVDLNNVMLSRLSQSKLYLKILGILYLIEETNVPITVERVLYFQQYCSYIY